jgi:hypothetical protein
MATTTTDLFRSLMGDAYKSTKLTTGVYPGDGILYPRFEASTYQRKDKKTGKMVDVVSKADLTVVVGRDGPEVLPDGGTSLHDIPRWFPCKEFVIPEGTEYTDEIDIKADGYQKTARDGRKGTHYQLNPKSRMTVEAFKGALDNMTRAAVVRQVALAKVGK